MDLVSYASLAVRLVNTAVPAEGSGDELATAESYRDLVGDQPQLASRVTPGDLDALRALRDEVRCIFTAAAARNDSEAVDRLNALLIRHPLHQQITSHDGQHWHLHLVESGSASDRFAAAAIAGLTELVTESGTRRLGMCASRTCERVFIASSPGGGGEYCSDRCAPRASVRALRAAERTRGQDPASPAAS